MKENLYKIADNPNLKPDDKLTQMVGFVMSQMDIDRIARKTIGSFMNQLKEKDRARYLVEFRSFLFSSLKASASDALLVPSKHVKMRKNPIRLSSQYFDIIFDVTGTSSNFPFILSVRMDESQKFNIVNLAVDNIDIVGTQSMLFKSHLEQNGPESVFELMKEQM